MSQGSEWSGYVRSTHDPRECSVNDCEEERYSWVGMQYHQLRDHLEASEVEHVL